MRGRMGSRGIAFLACLVLALSALQVFSIPTGAVTMSPVTLRPVSSGTSNAWTATGTPDGTCSGLCDYIDEASSDGDTTYLNGAAASASTADFGIGGSSVSGQTATSITVHVDARAKSNGLGWPTMKIGLTIGGVAQTVQQFSVNASTYQGFDATFPGSWSKSDVDNATVTISKTSNLLVPATQVTTMYATVTYQRPLQSQDAARLYANANSTAPGTPLANNEVATNAPFRLRLGLTPTDIDWNAGTWGAHSNLYKLRYAQLTAASCSAQSTGWNDVSSGSGAIRWYDNAGVADNAAIGSIGANDPTTSGTKVYQTYRESNGFTNTAITAGNTGIWDFSLVSSGQPAGLSFCFRVVKNDGTTLDTYSTYPKVTLTGNLGISVVDGSGADVASPVAAFSSVTTTTTQCNVATATLGVSSQRIRVTNALVTNGWNVSIAATGGPTSLWTAGASYYDFNDSAGSPSGCNDGGDSDALAGRLMVDPSSAVITPSSGCSNTGISNGSSTGFSEGTTDAITLESADATSQRFCSWDITGINLSQRVPKMVSPGDYSLDMTITVTAQ